VQEAVKIVMEPIFKVDFSDVRFDFRPNRSACEAIDGIVKYLNFGCENVIHADITGCFNNIPRNLLMQKIAIRISDGRILKLIKSFQNAGITENGAVTNPEGITQNSPLFPLLGNIYLNQFDRALIVQDRTLPGRTSSAMRMIS
jgi:retron-type reverse transcriptase